MGTYSSLAHGSNINGVAYGCVKGTAAKSFVAAVDLEKAAHHGASSSGESLATKRKLYISLQKIGSAAASPSPVPRLDEVLPTEDAAAAAGEAGA